METLMTEPGPSTPGSPAISPAGTQDPPAIPGRGAAPTPSAARRRHRGHLAHQAVPPTAPAPADPAAGRRTGLLVTLVLGGLTALAPLSMDMYLPALPQVTGALHSPAATVQLTLTTCLAGMALGQMAVGPMSDKWGRRRPLLAGMVIYVLATALCAFAPGAELLIAFRLLQGLAGAAGIVIARAVVRDLYDGVAMARFFSTLMLVAGVAPVVAPLIGGQILRITDWRGVFAVLTVVGVLLTLLVWRALPESLPPARRHSGGLGQTVRTMGGLLADRVFSGYLLAGAFAFTAMFAYISASPFVVQEIYGASPQVFGLLFGVNSVGLVLVGQINGKVLVGRVGLDKVLGTGLALMTVAAAGLLLMSSGAFDTVGLAPVAVGLFVMMAAMGLVAPSTNALAMQRTPHAAGSASALMGTSTFLLGSVASPLVGIAGERTAVPMALVQLSCTVLALVCFLVLCRPWQRRGESIGGTAGERNRL
ncbi:MFS transporter [Streptomyces chattanoogensis]|uniref:MFS transporter n=2 Tax=Streptomyces chattanoogensis TaxID=66876 RepID=A0A0N0XUI3_9ACTN|nr:multidrug effflux MFS transporter [Streptomyces chattanoogensis]KPC62468.1 MFS transporter [Streptomyces chattanoogensis]